MSSYDRIENKSSIGTDHHLAQESWLNTLVTEGPRLDETGTLAAVVAVESVAGSVEAKRLATLLRTTTHRTDQIHEIAPQRFAALLAPVTDIASAARRVHLLQSKAIEHGLGATVSFAIRRENEALLDTWARAEAELDRALFRRYAKPGAMLALEDE